MWSDCQGVFGNQKLGVIFDFDKQKVIDLTK